eukprot:COSAG05_NODE_2309_length_3245_cov_2.315003_2_plen_104_part_00
MCFSVLQCYACLIATATDTATWCACVWPELRQEILGEPYVQQLRKTRRKHLEQFVITRWGKLEAQLRQPLPPSLLAAAAAVGEIPRQPASQPLIDDCQLSLGL